MIELSEEQDEEGKNTHTQLHNTHKTPTVNYNVANKESEVKTYKPIWQCLKDRMCHKKVMLEYSS